MAGIERWVVRLSLIPLYRVKYFCTEKKQKEVDVRFAFTYHSPNNRAESRFKDGQG